MGLTSIHAPDGDSTSSMQTTKNPLISRIPKTIEDISNETDNGKYTVADIDKLVITSATADPHGTDFDDDSPMLDMDDEHDVQLVSDMLSKRRSSASTTSKEAVDSSIPMLTPTKLKSMFVVDTNFLISHLSTLETLRRLSLQFHHQMVIPNTVLQELDGLKNSTKKIQMGDNTEAIGLSARRANDWIYKNLANLDSGIMGQKLRQMINPDLMKDDAILDCCLYFKERLGCFVILLSNDKNLCMKALTEGILTVSFKKGMTAQLIASTTYRENLSIFGPGTTEDYQMPDVGIPAPTFTNFVEVAAEVFHDISGAVIETMTHVMNHEFGEEIGLIGFSPDTLTDLAAVAKCLDKFWVSVFAEYFRKSRIRNSDWKKLPACLTNIPTNPKELQNFVEFWQDILSYLYLKRSNKDNEDLQKLAHRWNHLAQNMATI